MIRRDVIDENGRPAWMLISQVEHAGLAGRLAEHWGAGPFAPYRLHADVLAAVFHHDDGWASWEESPGVDRQTGRPLDFTEMPAAEAVAIWRDSIGTCARVSPLAATLVSDHFTVLAQRAANWKKDAESARAMERFVAEQDGLRRQWNEQWRGDRSEERARQVEVIGLAQLQFFDIVSLWFCCSERSEAVTFDSPGGLPVTFSPRRSDQMTVAPWPFTVSELNLEVRACQIPVKNYPDTRALAPAMLETSLSWRLTAATDE